MDELNAKIAEWVGFTNFEEELGLWHCVSPQGEAAILPDFTAPVLGIARCFKYVVPKLDQAQYYECLKSIFVKTDKPALAFCKAVEKLIDGEGEEL